jgi:hypothetical protein
LQLNKYFRKKNFFMSCRSFFPRNILIAFLGQFFVSTYIFALWWNESTFDLGLIFLGIDLASSAKLWFTFLLTSFSLLLIIEKSSAAIHWRCKRSREWNSCGNFSIISRLFSIL